MTAICFCMRTQPAQQTSALSQPNGLSKPASRRRKFFNSSPELTLAYQLATANRRRLLVTLAGASLAVSLIIYQLFLIVGFVSSASSMIRSVDADLWVLPHEVQAFDFSTTLRREHAFSIAGFDGVEDVAPVVTGFASAVDARGIPSVVSIAGLPVARFKLISDEQKNAVQITPASDRFAFIDRTSLAQFGKHDVPFNLEISGQQVLISHAMEGYPTFLGSPFIVTSAANAQRWLRLPDDACTGIGVWLRADADVAATVATLARAYPELTVLTAAQFARRSATFWLTGTGAGGGLLLSAVMAFGIGLLIVSQNLYASVLESLQHYTTLRAIGVEQRTLRRVVMAQSVAISLCAGVIGSVLAYVFAALTKAFVLGWIAQPLFVPAAMLVACSFIGVASSISAVRLIHQLQPAHALRQ
jgi:putative ABC transport system permease protein